MGLLNFFKKEEPVTEKKVVSRRSPSLGRYSRYSERFYLSTNDRLTEDFLGTASSINERLKTSLEPMRKKARQLADDNDYVRQFLGMVVNNVIGECGIKLQAKVLRANGTRDRVDQNSLEQAFKDWGRKANCCINTEDTWLDAQKLAAKCLARDGEVLIRRRLRNSFKYGMKIEVIESDRLDHHLNENDALDIPGNNRVIMGVEYNQDRAPVAYHVRRESPDSATHNVTFLRDRIPADQIIHLYIKDHPNQARGYTWLHTCGKRFNMLGGYEEAELVAARVGASKMGFFKGTGAGGFEGDEEDEEGNKVTAADPGTFEDIGDKEFVSFDPQHPTTAYGLFIKWVLRGAASGLGVAYNSLANDLEGVNFSSIRTAVLAEREAWKVLQTFMIEHMHDVVYEWFLTYGLLRNAITGPSGAPLPFSRFDKFRNVHWQGRRWQWVDPVKDAQTNNLEEAAGHTSKTRILAEKGLDFEEVLMDRVEEQKLIQELEAQNPGIDLSFSLGTEKPSGEGEGETEVTTNDDENGESGSEAQTEE